MTALRRGTLRTGAALLAVSLLSGCMILDGSRRPQYAAAPHFIADGQTGFIDKTMVVDGRERKYVVYVPPDYDPRQSWPLIVFLHGASRRGADGEDMVGQGLGPAIAANPERFPCIVVMPQCPKGQRWDTAGHHIDTALDLTMREFAVDQSRVYLTGCSMGGFGIFYYGSERTELFAAMMPIAGGGKPEHSYTLSKVPVWVFHNRGDRIVPVSRSRAMVEALEQVNGDVRYTEYPDPGHDAWTKTYGNPEIIGWLLSQRKS